MYRAAGYGIGVAKPYGDSFPYDFLTQHGKRVLRVQVKSCFTDERNGVNGFNITVARSRGHGKITYEVGDIDFIAAFVAGCPIHSRSVRMSGNASRVYVISVLVLADLISIQSHSSQKKA